MKGTELRQRLRATAARAGWPALIVAAAIAWQYRAPLVGRVWFFEDIEAYFVPLYTAAARQMRLGSLAVWDPGAWSGQPLVGDPQLGLFYPVNWLWLVANPVRLYAWLQLFHVVLGAAGMWALARARGRSNVAAATAAVALALGAFCVLELRHAMFVATTAWLPWLLWAIERYARFPTVDRLLWIGVTGALALVAGGWSMLAYGAIVVAILALAAWLRADDKRRVAVGLVGAALLALGLAAAQILPALAHARLSPRALGTTYDFASSYSWPSWRYLVTLFVPTLYGDDARGTWVGAPDQWELCGYGIGVVGGLLALLSLRLRERRGERIALLVATLIACDLALGRNGALHPLLFKLPLFGALRCPARALYIWTLAAPILAADGVDALATLRLGRLAPIALVAVAVELGVTWRAENPSTTLAAASARPAALAWLRAHGGPTRTTNDVHLGQPFHNLGLRWGFDWAGGYHSLPIWRYLNLLWISNHGAPYPKAHLGDDLTAQGLWRFSSPIVDALGVTFVLEPHARTIDARGFRRVFIGPDGVDLWQNLEAFPRAWVVYAATRVPDEQAAARAVGAATWRPGRDVIVEDDVALPAPGPTTPPPTQPVQLVRVDSTSLMLDVPLPRPGVLVVAEPWYPGWRVTVDGKPAPLLRVDYALRGVALPPGMHVLEFEYSCRPLEVGGCVSLTALALAAALSSWDARRRRRARQS